MDTPLDTGNPVRNVINWVKTDKACVVILPKPSSSSVSAEVLKASSEQMILHMEHEKRDRKTEEEDEEEEDEEEEKMLIHLHYDADLFQSVKSQLKASSVSDFICKSPTQCAVHKRVMADPKTKMFAN